MDFKIHGVKFDTIIGRNNFIIMVEDFNIPLSALDRTWQKSVKA